MRRSVSRHAAPVCLSLLALAACEVAATYHAERRERVVSLEQFPQAPVLARAPIPSGKVRLGLGALWSAVRAPSKPGEPATRGGTLAPAGGARATFAIAPARSVALALSFGGTFPYTGRPAERHLPFDGPTDGLLSGGLELAIMGRGGRVAAGPVVGARLTQVRFRWDFEECEGRGATCTGVNSHGGPFDKVTTLVGPQLGLVVAVELTPRAWVSIAAGLQTHAGVDDTYFGEITCYSDGSCEGGLPPKPPEAYLAFTGYATATFELALAEGLHLWVSLTPVTPGTPTQYLTLGAGAELEL